MAECVIHLFKKDFPSPKVPAGLVDVRSKLSNHGICSPDKLALELPSRSKCSWLCFHFYGSDRGFSRRNQSSGSYGWGTVHGRSNSLHVNVGSEVELASQELFPIAHEIPFQSILAASSGCRSTAESEGQAM